MNRVRRFSLCFCSLLILSCVTVPPETPQPRVTISPLFNPTLHNRLAVFVNDQTRGLGGSGAIREVEDEFMRAVISKGYTLAARSDIEQIAKELRFQQSDLTEKQVAKIGQVLNVPAVMIVSINSMSTEPYNPIIRVQGQEYYRTNASISARILSVQGAEVMWISSYSGGMNIGRRDSHNEKTVLSSVASIVASGLPPRTRR